MNFDFHYAVQIFPTLLRATQITAEATAGGMALALILGLLLAIGRMSRLRIVRALAGTYIEIIRNTPFLIQLYFVFYVLPLVGLTASALATGIIGLGVNYSAYTAEVYRAGISGVPASQWEAALSIHLSRSRTWRRVILPQAFRPITPILGNYLISMFKESALLSSITLIELFATAQSLAATNYRYYEPYTVVALIYLALSVPASVAVRAIDLRMNRSETR